MKKLIDETKIIKWIILLPIAGVILTSFILTNIFISSKHESHEQEIKLLKSNHILKLKNTIKERIEHLSLLLHNDYNQQLQVSKESVKDIVNIGHATLENIYKQNSHLSKKEIYKIIDERMKDLRFFKNRSGYYFIYDLEEGTSISLPSAPFLVGKSLKKLTDKNGKNLFDSYANIIKKSGEGFDSWYWNKPNSKEKLEKIGYIKRFKPLNIAIGTAVYLEDIKKELSSNAIKFVKTLEYSDKSYVFIMNKKGKALSHKNKSIINVPLENLDIKIQNNVNHIIEKASNNDGAFIEYMQSKVLFKELSSSKKISYVKHIPILNWIIGTGLYTNDLNTQVNKKYEILEAKLEEDIKTIISVSSLVTLIVIILLAILSRKIKNIFKYYSNSLENSNLELKKLNTKLEEKVKTQVNDIRQKDLILNQQSKLAAMGEMLGNIAHQWRQPLSAISTLASGIRIKKDVGFLDDKQLDDDLKGIVESTKILSHTIDDFRNFYSEDKNVHKFQIEDTIKKVLSLISANLKFHHIDLVLEIEEIEIQSYENELIQIILNVLNNAKDALEDMKKSKYLFIHTSEKEGSLILKIYDNAGGIQEDIKDRIFEPYFTTKFKSQGTGIGLYMTKNIIESSLKGSISAKNKTYEYKGKVYKGALFKIKLPLQIN